MYTTGFQNPLNGQWVVARYAFGRVTLEPGDDLWVKDGTISTETNAETVAYCQRYTNKRLHSLEDADQYLHEISDGQSEGFA